MAKTLSYFTLKKRWERCKEACPNCGTANLNLINPKVAMRLDTRMLVWLETAVQSECMTCGTKFIMYPLTHYVRLCKYSNKKKEDDETPISDKPSSTDVSSSRMPETKEIPQDDESNSV